MGFSSVELTTFECLNILMVDQQGEFCVMLVFD